MTSMASCEATLTGRQPPTTPAFTRGVGDRRQHRRCRERASMAFGRMASGPRHSPLALWSVSSEGTTSAKRQEPPGHAQQQQGPVYVAAGFSFRTGIATA